MELAVELRSHIPGLTLEEEIGRGANSVVYRARRGHQQYAVKLQRAERQGEEHSRRFAREAGLLARVVHPGLATICEIGQVGGLAYIVMEYVEGRTLAEVLTDGPLAEARLLHVGRTVAGALGQVHRQGLVHRDVKPQNILSARNGHIKLIDFGFASGIREERPSELIGTLCYCAPEQAGMLERPIDGRSDLYSLGVVLFEAATGRPPFIAAGAELLRQQAAMPAPSVRELDDSLSEGLARIIAKLLSKDPDDRYQTAESLVDDLARVEGGEEPVLDVRFGRHAEQYDSRLIGREEELGTVERAWREAAAGKGGILSISGEAGSGKSRLARELARRAQREDALILASKCTEGATLPFAPIRQALDDWIRRSDPGTAELIIRAVGDRAPLLERFSPRLGSILEGSGTFAAAPGVEDHFHDAVADFLIELAQETDGILFSIDDVQWMDDASREVMKRLVLRLERVPLLVCCTARDGRFLELAGGALRAHVSLEGLGDRALRRLIAHHLGSEGFDEALVEKISIRTGGNPLAVEEFLRSMIDSGVLLPSWGQWKLKAQALESLELPMDVLELIGRRIDHLGPSAKRVLAVAGVIGSSFDSALVKKTIGDAAEVNRALAEATRVHLVERTDGAEYVFVHDRAREAAVAGLEPDERRRIHRSIAKGLDRQKCSDQELYALAAHCYLGGIEHDPAGAHEACARAGMLAARNFAFDRAYELFTQASEAAEVGGLKTDVQLDEAFGEACARTGRDQEAVQHITRALSKAKDPLRRSRLRHALSKIAIARHDATTAKEEAVLAFAELGERAALANVLHIVVSLLSWIFGLILRLLPNAGSNPSVRTRERQSALVALYQHFSYVSYFTMEPLVMLQGSLRSYAPVVRLGPSRQYVDFLGVAGVMLGILGRQRLAVANSERAFEVARQLEDPIALARASFGKALMTHFLGKPEDAEKAMKECLEHHGRWLENSDYLTGCADLAWNLMMRGHAREALTWIERADARAALSGATSGLARGHTYRCYAGPVLAMLAQPAKGIDKLDDFATIPVDGWRKASYLAHRALLHVEQGELGAPLEEVITEVREMKLNPARVPLTFRHFYVAQATARLAQFERASSQGKERLRGEVYAAMRQLAAVAKHPTLRAHHLLLQAVYRRLRGRRTQAHNLLGRAEVLALSTTNRWVLFEVFRERARLLQNTSHLSSQQLAEHAYRLAVDEGWGARARAVRAEFRLERSLVSSGSSAAKDTTRGDVQAVRLASYLDSLLEMSLVSASSLDPSAQARAALDALVRLLGAERAFLFLLDDAGELVLTAGRDAEGADLAALSGYSMTVVERVRTTQEAVVVSGSEESELIDAESIVARDLRSIMAAPLEVRSRLVGIVYLDSRLARGLFTKEDVGILRGIANHIAFAIETARAARLESAVEAERAQRVLAETLRSVNATLNSTLDLDTVLDRLLESLTKVVPFDRAMVMLRAANGCRVVAERAHSKEMIGKSIDLGLHPELQQIIGQKQRYLSKSSLDGPTDYLGTLDVQSWIGVPLVVRNDVVGILSIESFGMARYDDARAEIVVAFAEQAATAVENARLFGEVQRRASTDALTGAFNRGQLFLTGEQLVRRAQRNQQPLSVLMVDVDHFKRINDTHGHAAGDRVLIEVVRAMQSALRPTDVLGRYGGEEFAVVLAEAGPEAARLVAERLLAAVSNLSIPGNDEPIRVTVSIGFASSLPGAGSGELSRLLDAADAALYQAKNAGRNRAVGSENSELYSARAPTPDCRRVS